MPIRYHISWNDSQTKKIYNATNRSEQLMENLERSLLKYKLVALSGELPLLDAGREYGVMIYYYKEKPRRKLLTAAPRRKNNYIHVELSCGLYTQEELKERGFRIGNYKGVVPDLFLESNKEIDLLIRLISARNYKLV